VSLDPPKSTFSGDYISVLRGCCPPHILHVLQIDKDVFAVRLAEPGGLKLSSAPYIYIVVIIAFM